jgi:hypothetical protein
LHHKSVFTLAGIVVGAVAFVAILGWVIFSYRASYYSRVRISIYFILFPTVPGHSQLNNITPLLPQVLTER